MFQKCCESQEHPCLRPPYIGDFDRVVGKFLIVEVPLIIPHISHCPSEDSMGQTDIIFIEMFEGQKRDDTLCHAVNIDGVGTIVKIFGCSIISEKVLSVEIESATDMRFELKCPGILAKRLQSAKVVPRVEIVCPTLCG